MSQYEDLILALKEHGFNTSGLENQCEEFMPPVADTDAEYVYEVVVENQRGIKVFGIPLFSGKSLLPIIDPPVFSRLNGNKVLLPHDTLYNFALPDLDWTWSWKSWYVLMLDDVDEVGWAYSSFWRLNTGWHGKFYFGDFVRRRLWLRLRQRKHSRESRPCL